jgi:hypothetical protein
MKRVEPPELTLLPGQPSIEETLALYTRITGRTPSAAEEREIAELLVDRRFTFRPR